MGRRRRDGERSGALKAEGKRADDSVARAALLASIVDSSDDAIITKTLAGIVTSWNHAAERMYGYTAEEIIGKSISLLGHKDQPDEMANILKQIRDGRRVEHHETVRVKKDGTAISVSLTAGRPAGPRGRDRRRGGSGRTCRPAATRCRPREPARQRLEVHGQARRPA